VAAHRAGLPAAVHRLVTGAGNHRPVRGLCLILYLGVRGQPSGRAVVAPPSEDRRPRLVRVGAAGVGRWQPGDGRAPPYGRDLVHRASPDHQHGSCRGLRAYRAGLAWPRALAARHSCGDRAIAVPRSSPANW